MYFLFSLYIYLFLNTNRRRDTICVAGGGRHADLFREEEVVVQQRLFSLFCFVFQSLLCLFPSTLIVSIHSYPPAPASCILQLYSPVVLAWNSLSSPLSLIWNSLLEYPKLQTIYCPIGSLNKFFIQSSSVACTP